MKYKKTIKKRFRKKKRSNKSKKYGGSSQRQISRLELENKINYLVYKLAERFDYLVKTEQYIEEIKREIQTFVDQLGNNERLDINQIVLSSIEARVRQQLRAHSRIIQNNH
jgi:hypothetical protein